MDLRSKVNSWLSLWCSIVLNDDSVFGEEAFGWRLMFAATAQLAFWLLIIGGSAGSIGRGRLFCCLRIVFPGITFFTFFLWVRRFGDI